MKFWKQVYPISVIGGLWLGLMTQFVWKMIYFPEPLIPIIGELIVITAIASLAIWKIWRNE